MRRLVIVPVLLFATPAAAGGYAVSEQSATAGGTAGAATARAGDASAAWYNPAALADDGGWRVGAGLVLAMAQLHATGTDGSGDWQADTDGGAAPVPQLHASYASGDLAIGVAVGVPFGGDVAWPEDWAGRHEIIATRLAVARIAPFAAWRLGRVALAGGVHVDAGQLRIQRSLDFVDAEGDVDLLMHGSGLGVDLAAFVRISDAIDVGASYRSRTRLAMTGDADFDAPDAFSRKTADQHVATEVVLPDRLAIGGAWRRGALTVLGDLEIMAWSINERQVIDFAEEQTPDVVRVNDWHTTVAVRAGAEWHQDRWAARGGLAYDPSPSGDDRLSPVTPDADRLQASVGGTYQVSDALAVDGFYGFMKLLERSSSNPDSMMADYSGQAHLLGLGVRWTR